VCCSISARCSSHQVCRACRASGPDQLWVADITYVPTFEGHLYLAVVLDAWSRKIVGWSMQDHLLTDLVVEAFDMAVARRNPSNVIRCYAASRGRR
jgi:putative transposase